MRFIWLKRLLVFICIFSILESTGVSITSLLIKTNTCQSDCHVVNDDDDAAERNESKESSLKEFWAIHHDLAFPQPHIYCKAVIYPDEKSSHHLAWVSPVPTPPPNYTV
ncbi:hypothetical protein [Mucilaginibacter aquariorum]|uniref:Uncharacterized protein n=1 Tax=Mucilaginibacter aquariorum TaxID=2967225 RepID=A0ABT1T905_9SPHI|nr:hypothetical protein [Mucilaginibacter aquariorum]MCQ6960875.1 hypothetical protein [Mucilaginibacter aquariorum]